MSIVLIAAGCILIFLMNNKPAEEPELNEEMTIEYFTEKETEISYFVPSPEIDEQLLSVNPYSRPGDKISSLDYIVIHYLGNPKTTGQENRDYFESLKDLQNVSMSANYVVGLDGEIIHCVPDDEIAYASNEANEYSISIENCHMDDTGKLNTSTYNSLVHLTAYLSEKYGIDREHIIRHFDVTGKDCPKYFVDNPKEWDRFLDKVMDYREECRENTLQEYYEEKSRETEYLGLSELLDDTVNE